MQKKLQIAESLRENVIHSRVNIPSAFLAGHSHSYGLGSLGSLLELDEQGPHHTPKVDVEHHEGNSEDASCNAVSKIVRHRHNDESHKRNNATGLKNSNFYNPFNDSNYINTYNNVDHVHNEPGE